MRLPPDVSVLTLNRLSLYLRCLARLRDEGVRQIASKDLADRFDLSATQIRKDLAQFGEFGIRGVGYDVTKLAERLTALLGLDRRHPMVIVGMGNLGSALASFPGFNSDCFEVVAGFDNDPAKVGRKVGAVPVHSTSDLPSVVARVGAEIGVLAVPAAAAQENYDALVDSGARAVLNFAPVLLRQDPAVPAKTVDLRIDLEALSFLLGS